MTHFIQVVTLAMSLIYLASGKGNISADLSFDCAKNGSMMIFGKNAGLYGSMYAVGTALGTSNKSTCSFEKHIYGDSVVFEIKGCDIKQTVSVIFMRDNQTWSTNNVVIGGKNVSLYELRCNDVPIGGYIINRTVNLNESAEVTYKPYTESPLELTMEIKDSRLNALSTPVLIGTELHLVISGNDGFEFRAEICIASDGPHGHNKTLISNGSPMDTDILSNFTKTMITTVNPNVSSTSQLKHSMEAILYAFHFVDSYDVEIMCNMIVCQNDDFTCPLTTESTIPTPPHTVNLTTAPSGTTAQASITPMKCPRRRRRDVLGLPQTQLLRATFRVVDQFGDNDGSVKTSGAFKRPVFWLPLVFLAVSIVRTLM